MPEPSFTCPRCGRTSHNPTDVVEGYCGACHDWTGRRNQIDDPFSRNDTDARGLRVHADPLDATAARQLVGVGTDSTAVHSRSKGWLPMVLLSIDHVPLINAGAPSERLQLMLGASEVELLIEHLVGAFTAATADAATGPIEDLR